MSVELFLEEYGCEEEDRNRAYACHRVDFGCVCLGKRGVQESHTGRCEEGRTKDGACAWSYERRVWLFPLSHEEDYYCEHEKRDRVGGHGKRDRLDAIK